MSKKVTNIVHNAATVTSSSTSATFNNTKRKDPLFVDVLAVIGAAPTGTSPTLTYRLEVSNDGTNFATIATGSTLNSQTNSAINAVPVTEPFYRVGWTIGGSGSPSFTLVTTTATGV